MGALKGAGLCFHEVAHATIASGSLEALLASQIVRILYARRSLSLQMPPLRTTEFGKPDQTLPKYKELSALNSP